MTVQKATNIVMHQSLVQRVEREKLAGHRSFTLWFTGLSASGKSTLAVSTERLLFERGFRTYVLDGDNVRHGLNKNLGFSPDDRQENIRRLAEVAKLFRDAGIINLTAFISPYIQERDFARSLAGNDDFIEIFVDCPVEICAVRDPKGMYQKAKDGIIKDFTGVSAPYEIPPDPELHIQTDKKTVEECTQEIVHYLEMKKLIPEIPVGSSIYQKV